jgi:hypothetical protein
MPKNGEGIISSTQNYGLLEIIGALLIWGFLTYAFIVSIAKEAVMHWLLWGLPLLTLIPTIFCAKEIARYYVGQRGNINGQ